MVCLPTFAHAPFPFSASPRPQLSSSNFDLEANNLDVGDSREGLDSAGAAEVHRIMREERVNFDEVSPGSVGSGRRAGGRGALTSLASTFLVSITRRIRLVTACSPRIDYRLASEGITDSSSETELTRQACLSTARPLPPSHDESLTVSPWQCRPLALALSRYSLCFT